MSGLLFSQSETTLFFRALNHAVIAHRGQKREGTDFPYVTHPITAARCIAEETEYPVTPQLIVAALLHDILEDTDEIIESFPEDVRNLVLLVTDPDREEGHRLRAVERIFGNPDAILLKMADRVANLSEENPFCSVYREMDDVRESTEALLRAARAAGLGETDLYHTLLTFSGVHSRLCLAGEEE
jgi:(p)ppGpp synthase/HD superfamily hydrolase